MITFSKFQIRETLEHDYVQNLSCLLCINKILKVRFTSLLRGKQKSWVREVLRNRSMNDAYCAMFQELQYDREYFFFLSIREWHRKDSNSKSIQRKRKVYSVSLS